MNYMNRKVLMLIISILLAHWGYSQTEENDLIVRINAVDIEGYKMAIDDIKKNFPDVELGKEWSESLETIESQRKELVLGVEQGNKSIISKSKRLLENLDNTLLQNPLIKDKEIYMIKREVKNPRSSMGGAIGLSPSNFQNNSEINSPKSAWNNCLIKIDLSNKKTEEVFKPQDGVIITDLEPHFSGEKLMYSSIGTNDRWHLFELDLNSGQTVQLTPEIYKDFDSFDGIYTPDGKYIFCATATFLGLPCTDGGNKMCGLFSYDPKTKESRQLTFDQDSNWEPVVKDDGQILYQRWEYADLPHSNSRVMFTMNPDGTTQLAYYGSNSYFPAAMFGARPIPNSGGKFVATVSGHHSVSRSGMLMIFDPSKGRKEADGVIAEIPHRGRKVQPIVRDRQSDGIWPQFLTPYPLNDKYHIVTMKATPTSLWGVYLVDTFNNLTLIYESEEHAILEPKLVENVVTPPVIPERIDRDSKTATVFIQDIYFGGGLKGIPRGEVKKLRVGSYDFSPLRQGGLLGTMGLDGPWDLKLINGEVDVEEDGSAMFTIPANTPIFVQPLDKDGKALQIMRSWFTAMPGEILSCLGCHEERNSIVQPKASIASQKEPQPIKPFQGVERGLSFEREIQPILDRACVACHNGTKTDRPNFKKGVMLDDWTSSIGGHGHASYAGKFSESYYQLQRYVRRPGIESDIDMLAPMDVHADQTELFQILNSGHYGVELSKDEVAILAMWVDFNAQYHGRRKDISSYGITIPAYELRKKYATVFGYDFKENDVIAPDKGEIEPEHPERIDMPIGDTTTIKDWPRYDGESIASYTANDQVWSGEYQRSIDLGDGVTLDMIKVPAGEYKMGGDNMNEQPISRQKIDNHFWIGKYEITNEQYAQFNKEHDSRYEHRHGYQFGRLGYALNKDEQPVVRVSWNDAMAFCDWLSEKTGLKVTLPTEKEWEWAARSGSSTPYPFGKMGCDYTKYANMGDVTLKEYAACTSYKFYESAKVIDNASRYDDWVPRDTIYNDGEFVSSPVGRYRSNAWDLYDMHGNVWEWTLSEYKRNRLRNAVL